MKKVYINYYLQQKEKNYIIVIFLFYLHSILNKKKGHQYFNLRWRRNEIFENL